MEVIYMPEEKQLNINQLKSHPKNPRLSMHEETIEGVMATIHEDGGLPKAHRIQVWPDDDCYLILDGHHRFEAAQRCCLETIPCLIRDELDEDRAYLEVINANNQTGFSPLEIGIHALYSVKKTKGGSGKKGGLNEYAKSIGKNRGNLTTYTNAAEVYLSLENLFNVKKVLSEKEKTLQLATIYKLPEECRQKAVNLLTKKDWTVKETENKVKQATNEGQTIKQIEALLTEKITLSKLKKIWELNESISNQLTEERKVEWDEWYKENDPLDIKELHKKRNELEEQEIESESQNWTLEVANIQTYQTNEKFDFIITDPPYPKEYLYLFEELAKRSNDWLKDQGLLVVMSGQSYLPDVIQMMQKHLDYYWLANYHTPGQPKPLQQKQVNSCCKPILIFTKKDIKYKGKPFSDFFKSNQNEKDSHKWGQSISGMYSIISQICVPEQSIFDPFCGGGTTGVATLQHSCYFHGIDIDEDNIKISARRLKENDTTKA